MNKLKQYLQEKANLTKEIRSLTEAGKIEEAEEKMNEVRSLNKKIELETELQEEEKRQAAAAIEAAAGNQGGTEERGTNLKPLNVKAKSPELEERQAFYKAITGKPLNAEERLLVASAVNADGGFLVPKDIKNDINLLKRQYKSMAGIITSLGGRIPVTTESGSFVFEDTSTMTDLLNFDDTTTGLAETQPKFRDVQWKVTNYGAITPIARSFLQDETANFMTYLNGYFARKAVRTENTKIFTEMRTGKTVVPLTTLATLKNVVNVQLDPALQGLSVWVMNQDAFSKIDEMVDTTNKPLLNTDPADATRKLLLGLPVHVFSNAELPSITSKGQIFVGALGEGVKYFDRDVYEVAVSSEAGFKQNQVVARVVERFDAKQADAAAYVWCNI